MDLGTGGVVRGRVREEGDTTSEEVDLSKQKMPVR